MVKSSQTKRNSDPISFYLIVCPKRFRTTVIYSKKSHLKNSQFFKLQKLWLFLKFLLISLLFKSNFYSLKMNHTYSKNISVFQYRVNIRYWYSFRIKFSVSDHCVYVVQLHGAESTGCRFCQILSF